ncbi:MAG TPA: TRAP transporter permease DctM/Q [Polaromonas sp.]|uniref:TRAP transporter small permease n=1 Tax=Polaromonas sp. UBA4122 TaxID=1947074 RepID=UPI000ED1445C|nr:TRAP transporter small permease [Polaromonas sp. UBA4122]HAL38261.1 TRAP transporter permease DctM/Q [Polaromonas sp.]
MRKLIDWLYRGLQGLLTFLIAILILPVTMQIVARFTDLIPNYIWTEEMARFCLIWIIMLGASVAVRDGTHFDVDVLPHPKTVAGLALSRMVVHGVIFLVALIFLAFGWRFAMFGYDQSSELTGINMITIHIAWPFAGFTWVVFTLEKFYDDLQLMKKGKGAAYGAV